MRQVEPGELECVTPLPAGLAPPEASPTPPMRPCGQRFRGDAAAGPAPNDESGIDRIVEEQVRAEELRRHHEAGLVEVDAGLGLVGEGGLVPLRDLWVAVSAAVRAKAPAADLTVLDDRRLDQLPSRWPPRSGLMQSRRLARWNAAVDRLAVPAWDTGARLSSSGGVADTFAIDQLPLFLGANDVLYFGLGRPTPAGTQAEWQGSYGSAAAVPGAWTAKWMPYGTYYPRQEAAAALAGLARRFDLELSG